MYTHWLTRRKIKNRTTAMGLLLSAGSGAWLLLILCANERTDGRCRRFYKRARSKNTPAAAAHTWLCDGGHETLFSGHRRRRRPASPTSPAARPARHIWFGPATLRRHTGSRERAEPPRALFLATHVPTGPASPVRPSARRGEQGRGTPLEIVQNSKFFPHRGRATTERFLFTSIFTPRVRTLADFQ